MSETTIEGLPARWYDGRSSRVRAVRLQRHGDVLRLLGDDDAIEEWPLTEIRISPRLGSMPRTLRRAGHGHLEVADEPELQAWFPRPPSRVEAFADFLERRRTAILVSALATVALTVAFVHYGVPWLAQRVAERMPRSVERHLSDQVVAVLDRAYFESSEVEGGRRERLTRAFAAMVRGEARADDMHLRFVDAPKLGPNALTLPDGRIFITDDLLALPGSDDEILSVLAHEAGHHVHRHGIRQAIESSSIFIAVGLLLGDVSGSSLTVSVPAVLLSNGFSRDHEREADAYGIDLMRRSGRRPQAFASMMRRLDNAAPQGDGDGAMGYLSTHPPTAERIRAAERGAARP